MTGKEENLTLDGTRATTGIPGFDDLVEGGLPHGSTNVVAGSTGTGKTIFGLQFLQHGASQRNEAGVYISLEQSDDDLRAQAKRFGWDLRKLEKEGKLAIVRVPVAKRNVRLFDVIKEAVEKVKAKRLVIDSLSIIEVNASMYSLPLDDSVSDALAGPALEPGRASFNTSLFAGEPEKQFIYLFVDRIKQLGITTLFVTESPMEDGYLTRDTVSEFACDGVVKLTHMLIGTSPVRMLTVYKMRATACDTAPRPYRILSGQGIALEKPTSQ
jgi:KaiC/GvpD/RAD55 family RecA-like ATPase